MQLQIQSGLRNRNHQQTTMVGKVRNQYSEDSESSQTHMADCKQGDSGTTLLRGFSEYFKA